MEAKTIEYFSSLNPLAKKVIGDVQLVEQMFGEEWEGMDWRRQEDIMDDFFVDPNTRKKYQDQRKLNEYQKSFPKLIIQSGEKIVVEMENDFWTWQDEHSAPFSWKSKSQQDLTLLDLEPEQMSKPLSSKTRKGSQGSLGEGVVIDNVAPKEFVYQPGESLWYTTFPAALKKLNDMPPAPNKIKQTKSSSGSGGDKSPEEINYAFKDSSYDVRGITNGEISNLNSGSMSNKSNISNVKTKEEPVIPPRKSRNVTKPQVKPPEPPSATKLKQSSSFSKKEKKSNVSETMDKEEVTNDNTSDVVDPASNAFDNPGLIKDWTQAVEGDSEGCSSSSSSPSRKPLLREPLSQAMDRESEEKISISQYGHDYGENEDSRSLLNATERPDVDLNAAYIEHTAVPMKLNVDDANTTEDFDMKKTGFDFLDNW